MKFVSVICCECLNSHGWYLFSLYGMMDDQVQRTVDLSPLLLFRNPFSLLVIISQNLDFKAVCLICCGKWKFSIYIDKQLKFHCTANRMHSSANLNVHFIGKFGQSLWIKLKVTFLSHSFLREIAKNDANIWEIVRNS